MPVKLHAHQEEAVEKLHNGCILYGDVGVGKTITSLGYYFERVCGGQINEWGSMQKPKDLYVITTAKVRDSKAFELQAAHFGVHADPSISTNGVKITVDSWNNLYKYVGVSDAFFIFDEQRVVGYGAWARAFIKIARANKWILLSATPGDTWMDYIPVFIANGWYKHKTDFIDQHVIWTPRVKYPKVLRYQDVGTLVRRRNDVLVRMPYERHTVRHPVDIWCDYDEDQFEKVVKKRWHVFENRPLRDVSELFSVMRKVVNSDESRLNAVRTLTQKHPKLIVFYNFDYELEMLRELGANLSTSSSENGQSSGVGDPQTSVSPSIGSGGCESTENPRQPSVFQETTSPCRSMEASFDCQRCQTGTCEPPSLSKSSNDSSADISTSDLTPSRKSGSSISSNSEPVSPSLGSTSTNGLTSTSTASGFDPTASFAFAEWNGHKHQEIPTTDRWLYAVQYRAGAEGWNCVETDAICFFSQTYSYRDWWQSHGRIDRLNTPFIDLWYYHLVSRSIIDKAIRKALKAKKSFNERDLAL